MERRHGAPAERQLRLRDVACQLPESKSLVLSLFRSRIACDVAISQRPIQALHMMQRVLGIDGAHDDEDGVARLVEVAVEPGNVSALEGPKELLAADPP